MTGKGDKQRRVDKAKYDRNYDAIRWKPRKRTIVHSSKNATTNHAPTVAEMLQ